MSSDVEVYWGLLQRFFFGDEPWKIAERDSDVEKLFRKFFSKLQTKLQRYLFFHCSFSFYLKNFFMSSGILLPYNFSLSSLNANSSMHSRNQIRSHYLAIIVLFLSV